MGVFDTVRGRDEDGRMARAVVENNNFEASESFNSNTGDDAEHATPEGLEGKHAQTVAASAADSAEASLPTYAPNASSSSFGINGVDDDEKEAERNPDHVTDQAGLGQQKAEAAALVWNRAAVVGIYVW